MYHYKPENSIWQGALFSSILFHKLKLDLTKNLTWVIYPQEVPAHECDIGIKLEAFDQTDPSTITVATVSQVVGRTMWVLLDGYKNDSVERIYDVESSDLFPVGWCSMNGHPLITSNVQRKKFGPINCDVTTVFVRS